MTDWKQALDYNMGNLGNLVKGNGGIMKGYGELTKAAASKGALCDKTRELIALAVAATTRCDGCIAVHAAEAVKAGATRDELLETLAMAIALNTGAATIYSSRILEAFDQFSAK
ncbi:MAG: carboxymuconolactone decarboxylase family protein [Deltaproteobacteria bacterium]|nr:carboxymuconolactone decarboxylase family protein [Deltaproteobacteria bacterium]